MKESKAEFFGTYFFYFLLYSIIGWVYEVFLEVVVYRWGYSDRGVLFGPWCPVYGVGAMAFLLCLRPVLKKEWGERLRFLKPLFTFAGCMLAATAIELFTSYILEAVTGSWPWQTYLDYKINFQGRIALSPSLRFGLGGVIFLYVFQPAFERLTRRIPERLRKRLFLGLFVVFVIDLAATFLSRVNG